MTVEQKARAWDELKDFVKHLNIFKDQPGFGGNVTEVESITDLVKKIERKVTE